MFKTMVALLCVLIGTPMAAQELEPLPSIEVQSTVRIGKASWYGYECAKKKMANGKQFNPKRLTAASYYWPLGTRVEVRNLQNGKTVEVTITDRGPLRRLGRLIDLSESAANRLGYHGQGTTLVAVREE